MEIERYTKYVVVLSVLILVSVTGAAIVNNYLPPKADAGDDIYVLVGDTFTLNGSASSGDIVKYTWFLHDLNNTVLYGKVVNYSFSLPGVYRVSLFVEGANGLTSMDYLNVTVRIPIPSVTLGTGDLEVYEDENFTLNPVIWGESKEFNYTWDMGDGKIFYTSSVNYSYTYSGEYLVNLEVSNEWGAFGNAKRVIKVLNVKPKIVSVNYPKVIYEDTPYKFSVEVNDTPGDLKRMKYLWYFDDGSISFNKEPVHTFTESGNYSCYVAVKDDNGEMDIFNFTVRVKNVVPEVKISNVTVYEGQEYIFNPSYNDTSSDIPYLTFNWSFGDTGWHGSYHLPDDGVENISLEVTDDDMASAKATAHFNVLNYPPHIAATDAYFKGNMTIYFSNSPVGTVNVTLYEDSTPLFNVSFDGNMIEHRVQVDNITFHLNRHYHLVANYTSEFPGSDTIWVYLELSGDARRMFHHEFNTFVESTLNWSLELNKYFFKKNWEDHSWGHVCNSPEEWEKEYMSESYPACVYKNPRVKIKYQIFDPGNDSLFLFANYTYTVYRYNDLDYMADIGHPELPNYIISGAVCKNRSINVWRNYTASGYPMRIWDEMEYVPVTYNQTLNLLVMDDDGGEHHIKVEILNGFLHNSSPYLFAGNNSIVVESGDFHIDPKTQYPFNISIYYDFGDGTVSFSNNHIYNVSGDYLLTVHAVGNGVETVDGFIVHVENIPPSARIEAVGIKEGMATEFSSMIYDTSYDKSVMLHSWKTMRMEFPIQNATILYPESGNYTVRFTVQDDNGKFFTTEKNITVEEINPEIYTKNVDILINQTLVLKADFSDSLWDEFNSDIQWSLSDIHYSGYVFTHRFWKPGTYEITLSVKNPTGNSASSKYVVNVRDIPPRVWSPKTFYFYGPEGDVYIQNIAYHKVYSDVTRKWSDNVSGMGLHHISNDIRASLKVTAHDTYGSSSSSQTLLLVYMDEDCDNLLDSVEEEMGTNLYYWDSDGDYLPDYAENETLPTTPDTDGDWLADGYTYATKDEYPPRESGLPQITVTYNGDVYYLHLGERSLGTNATNSDTDGDGLPDGLEAYGWMINVIFKDGEQTFKVTSDPLKVNSDDDTLNDYQEYENGTNPENHDTDRDGLWDGYSITLGSNTMPGEASVGTSPTNYDTDGDGLNDSFESQEGWKAWWYDSSGAYNSIRVYSDPLSPDSDGDGLSDYQEYENSTNPMNNDTDGDGAGDNGEYYTKVFEYPSRYYSSGISLGLGIFNKISLKWRPETTNVKDAKVIVGLRANNGDFSADLYYRPGTLCTDGIKIGEITTDDTTYATFNIKRYIDDAYRSQGSLCLYLRGSGWVETFKVIILEESNVHKWDTDGDGLSDGYEINGEGGYVTSPVSDDTDGDGIGDYLEVKGWIWDYSGKSKHMAPSGFHTNPLSKDTDGDGVRDSEDVNPLANLVLRMSLEEYIYYDHSDYTKFAGLWAKWELNGESKDVVYYTEHKDYVENLHGYVYWFDIPDDIDTSINIKAGAFYNDRGDKELGEWSGSFSIKNEYSYWISVGSSNPTYNFMARFWVYSLNRVNTIAIYNETTFNNGHFRWSGKYYVLYVDSESGEGMINKGLNVIIVPDAIFVNSQLYSKIQDNDVSYLVGKDSDAAKMGAITTNTMGVHIVGMFFFKATAEQVSELLNLLIHNLTGKEFASYSTITPENANLPADVLRSIPLIAIENSPTGSEPKSLWEQISDAIGGAITSAVNFIANAVIAVTNFIAHAAEVIAQTAMQVFNTVASVVKTAVEVVKKVVDAAVEWVKEQFIEMMTEFVDTIKSAFNDIINIYANFLNVIVLDVTGAGSRSGHIENSENPEIAMRITRFIESLLQLHLILLGSLMVAAGVILMIEAASMGIGKLVETSLFTALKDTVMGLLIGTLVSGLWKDIQEVADDENADTSKAWDFISKYVGITVSYASTIVAIIEAFAENLKNKATSRFIIGLSLAISGYFLDAATTVCNFNGDALVAADIIGILVSSAGLVMMIKYRNTDVVQKGIETSSPLISIVEWVIGIGGFAKAIMDTVADASTGWSG